MTMKPICSEPDPWTDDDYPFGSCEMCEGPLDDDYECQTCAPRVAVELTPVRATFAVDTTTGDVTWSGACTEEFGQFIEEHVP